MNFGRKMMKAGVAAVAAIATLGAGGVVASTARTMLRAHGVRPRVLIRCAPP